MGVADFIAFLAPGLFETAEKHLEGQHDQQRHAWRYGSLTSARRSLQNIPDAHDREEYRRRAGMRDIHGGDKTPVSAIRSYKLDKNVVRYYIYNSQYEIDYAWEEAGLHGDPLDFVQKAYNVYDSGTHMRMKVTDITHDPWTNAMIVQGDILDHHDGYVGRFERTLDFEHQHMHHDLMRIREDRQREGFGTRVYQHEEKYYERAGIEMVYMTAGLEMGGYAWARMGFDFSRDSEHESMMTEVMNIWYRRYGSEMPGGLRRALKHSWNIAMVVGPDNALLGKFVMAGSVWDGYKYLDKKNIGYRVGKKYYASKRKR